MNDLGKMSRRILARVVFPADDTPDMPIINALDSDSSGMVNVVPPDEISAVRSGGSWSCLDSQCVGLQ